jgi:hypothetical protein
MPQRRSISLRLIDRFWKVCCQIPIAGPRGYVDINAVVKNVTMSATYGLLLGFHDELRITQHVGLSH